MGNSVAPHNADEVIGGESSESGFMEIGIARNEVFGRGVDVCEVASAAAGNSDFLAGRVVPLEHRHRPAALSRLDRAHQPGSAGSDDDDIVDHKNSPPELGGVAA